MIDDLIDADACLYIAHTGDGRRVETGTNERKEITSNESDSRGGLHGLLRWIGIMLLLMLLLLLLLKTLEKGCCGRSLSLCLFLL